MNRLRSKSLRDEANTLSHPERRNCEVLGGSSSAWANIRGIQLKLRLLISAMIVLVLLAAVIGAFAIARGSEISRGAGYLWYATFSYVVTLAVEADRKSRHLSAPFEYAAFVFVAWPLVVPYYLYQIKGWGGIFLGLGLVVFSCVPDLVAFATYLLMSE